MRKVFIVFVVMLVVVPIVMAEEVPQKVWDSPLLLRPGVDDGLGTVGKYFKNSNFVEEKMLDGTKVNIQWGNTKIEYNTIIRPLEIYGNGKLDTRITYYLQHNEGKTILTKVRIEGKKDEMFDSFENKVYTMRMLMQVKADL